MCPEVGWGPTCHEGFTGLQTTDIDLQLSKEFLAPDNTRSFLRLQALFQTLAWSDLPTDHESAISTQGRKEQFSGKRDRTLIPRRQYSMDVLPQKLGLTSYYKWKGLNSLKFLGSVKNKNSQVLEEVDIRSFPKNYVSISRVP